ncbi:hypothetical protein F5882DRAFT_470310 [Hyaloscypha sp. PMI_1271]|nr:hypothetical protein F5882DRAFT_470310 [Hyaloscypha sp. PMI_1271]
MRTYTISVVLACVGGVLAGDMRIDFPLFMRAPAPAGTGTNLQAFTGALGGAAADPITQTGNSKTPFAVDGSTFADLQTAGIRSCNNQHNECARTANASGDKSLTVGMCDQQQTQCVAAQTNSNVVVPGGSNGAEGTTRTAGASTTTTTTTSAQPTLRSADADFFYFCDP